VSNSDDDGVQNPQRERDGAEGSCTSGSTRRATSKTSGEHAPQRIATALKLLAEGKRYTEVRGALQAAFRISRATAERDLARAYAEIAAEAEAERPTLAARIADRIWRAMLRAERRKDDYLALAAIDRLVRLYGLGVERERVVVRDAVDADDRELLDALKLTPAQRIAEIRQHTADLRAAGVDPDVVDESRTRGTDDENDNH